LLGFVAAAQAALLVAVLGLMGARGRAVLFRRSLDAEPYRRAVTAAFRAGDLAEARRLADAARGTWIGAIGAAALEARDEGEVAEGPLGEAMDDVRRDAFRGLVWLRAAVRIAPLLGLVGAAVSLGTGQDGGGADPAALGQGLSFMVVGVVTAFVAADGLRTIGLVALGQVRAAARLARVLDALEPVGGTGSSPAGEGDLPGSPADAD